MYIYFFLARFDFLEAKEAFLLIKQAQTNPSSCWQWLSLQASVFIQLTSLQSQGGQFLVVLSEGYSSFLKIPLSYNSYSLLSLFPFLAFWEELCSSCLMVLGEWCSSCLSGLGVEGGYGVAGGVLSLFLSCSSKREARNQAHKGSSLLAGQFSGSLGYSCMDYVIRNGKLPALNKGNLCTFLQTIFRINYHSVITISKPLQKHPPINPSSALNPDSCLKLVGSDNIIIILMLINQSKPMLKGRKAVKGLILVGFQACCLLDVVYAEY